MNAVAAFVIAAGVALFAVAILEYWVCTASGRKFFNVYNGRRPLTDDEMFDVYLTGTNLDRSIVSRIRQIFGHQLDLDSRRILPDDDFGRIYWDLDFFELVCEVEEAFEIHLAPDELATTDGTIRNLAALVQQKLALASGPISSS